MAFEIEEISIQMEVSSNSPGSLQGDPHVDSAPDRTAPTPVDVDAIVAQCVRATIRLLEQSRRR
jgi:Family of unknown function (DUF5908)